MATRGPVDTASYPTSRVCELFQVDLKKAAEMPLDEVGIHSGVGSLPAVVRTSDRLAYEYAIED